MSARRISRRELILADLVWIAKAVSRSAAAELIRRGDAVAIAIAADDLALAPTSIAAAASGAALALAEGREEEAIRILAEDCGLTAEEWLAATCDEQVVELAPADLSPTPAEAQSGAEVAA